MFHSLSSSSRVRNVSAALVTGGLLLTAVVWTGASAAVADTGTTATATKASSARQKTLSGKAVGTFAMAPCPANVEAGAFCATDTWASTEFDGLGTVTGSFTVEFDQPSFQGDCGEVHKTGTIKVDDANTVSIKADGFACQDAGNIVTYSYKITGGTGKFARACGTGLWLVPPPTSMSGQGGVGPEILHGTLQV